MKWNWNEHTRDSIVAYTTSGIIIVLAWSLVHNFSLVGKALKLIWDAILPFVIGYCLAFIIRPLRTRVQEKWLANTGWKPRTRRKVAVTISFTIFCLVIVSFFLVLIPQLTQSTRTLIDSMDTYMSSFSKFLDQMYSDPQVSSVVNNLYTGIRGTVTGWFTGASGFLSTLLNYSLSFVKGVFNFFIGLIVAVYLLLDQEQFERQFRMVNYAVFRKDHADHIYEVLDLASKMFSGFIFGKALDSLIIGILCYICCVIMGMPYSPLIAFVVGITNMIPFFGPFIGAIPCAFILLIISPVKAVEFGFFILILQQIDGNIIGPKILGGSLGLPALWVMFAIIVGGAMFGILGMFFAVPVFSVIYVLCREKTKEVLARKRIRTE